MVVLSPCEWRVTGSNLVRYEIDFIFARCSFGSKCERAKGATKRGYKPLYNDPLIEIKPS